MAEATIALLFFLFPLAWSPGPGNMFFAANGARFGLRATIPANAGYHVATWILTVAIGAGFSSLISSSPELFTLVRWLGAGYLLYLASVFLRAGANGQTADARPAGFVEGVFLLVLNPKAYVIIVLMFSQFLTASTVDHSFAVVWIATVFTLNNLVAFLAWTAVGDRLAARFRDESAARVLNIVLGLALVGVALWAMLG